MLPENVTEKLEILPVQPGVYLFKDKKGSVVYVGKAKSLRSRVRSYFQESGSDTRYFIPILQRTIGDLDTIVTSTEKEAAILENTLIKEHQPRYNVKLRDDKEFLSIRLATDHAWPRLDVVRKPAADGARYFGPYHSATSARRTLHLINKHFQLRTCSDVDIASRKRPCLQHQIKRCPAPCVKAVDPTWYGEQVGAVEMFLDGRHDELSAELDERMKHAAKHMQFELAAVYRDQLRAIDAVREDQRVVSEDRADRDVVGLYREGELVELALLYIRVGKLAGVATFSIKQAEIDDDEIIAAFMAQHYAEQDEAGANVLIAPEILLPCEPEGVEGIAEWLADRAGRKITIHVPKRGSKLDLLTLAIDNARHAFLEKRRQSDDIEERLRDLQQRLRLPQLPRRIECCDISHMSGGDTTGAIVAMRDGQLDKKRYRSFHVKGSSSTATGNRVNDDYGSMYEVLARRFRRAQKAQEAHDAQAAGADVPTPDGEWDLPDLFVVDGGRGQLAVALTAARDLGLHDLSIAALAKERESITGDEIVDRVYLPGQKNPIPLRSNTTSLFLLARLRDEAHRFSNRAREKLGKVARFRSELDDIKGIGPKAKKMLLIHFGGVAGIKNADDEALARVPGIQARHVKAIRARFPAKLAEKALEEKAPDG